MSEYAEHECSISQFQSMWVLMKPCDPEAFPANPGSRVGVICQVKTQQSKDLNSSLPMPSLMPLPHQMLSLLRINDFRGAWVTQSLGI